MRSRDTLVTFSASFYPKSLALLEPVKVSSRFASLARLAAIIGVALGSWCLDQGTKLISAQPPPILRPPTFTVSKDTTWATEPVGADGFIDYMEIVNKRLSKDVTPENNSAVLLFQAIGPHPDGMRQPDRFFQLMGMKPPPDSGKYYQSLSEWILERPDEVVNERGISRMQWKASESPWKKDDIPLIAAWLRDNEAALLTVTAATERPMYFSPLVPPASQPNDGLFDIWLPVVQIGRDVVRALVARAMWELAEGSQVDSWRDLMAAHRLGRLVGHGPTLVESLVGTAMESLSFEAEFRFLSETMPSTKMLAQYRKELARLPPRASIAGKLDLYERATFLDCAQRLAHGQMSLQSITGGAANNPLLEKLTDKVIAQTVDWNKLRSSGNNWYDRFAGLAREPASLERRAAIRKLDQDLEVLVEKRDALNLTLALSGDTPAITQAMSDTWLSHQGPSVGQILRAEGRAIQRMHNLELAFALAQWRNEHDSYPESLDKLVPKFISKVPEDHFNNRPLTYKRIADGYLFYSVGENETDENGHSYNDNPRGDDLVVRMPVK